MSERLHGFVKSHGVRGETTAPVLTMEPPWVRFLTGDRIVLTCDAGRRSRSKNYIWHISDRGDRPGEESYTIMNASKNDSGVYKCKTTTDSSGPSTPYSNTIHVNITEPDRTMTIETLPEILWVNENLLLRCHFPFTKDAIYTFYREGFRLGEATVSNGSGTFEIQRVSVEDKGRYRCELHFVNFPNGPIYSSAYKFVHIKGMCHCTLATSKRKKAKLLGKKEECLEGRNWESANGDEHDSPMSLPSRLNGGLLHCLTHTSTQEADEEECPGQSPRFPLHLLKYTTF
ncbi:high affinity immunoglobulin epsilon receptor subunit alpha-like [Scyliorhinus torazame]|uniref:high affinity immunoglobulin epsilon receptor subunit alpha-like n=1 Tax=Scyliorhinus torazame TaxID=75743 RepID=UPI003B5AD5F2